MAQGSTKNNNLTDAQLRATPVPVSGTVTVDTSLLATSAKQDTLFAAVDTLESIFTDVIGFETIINLTSGSTYSSGLLALSPPYSQVLTNILSDRTGTMNIYWYSDAGGTDLVRTLTIAYTAGDGFLSFGAPAFTKYVKYEFTNSAGASTTDFYYTTKFLTKPTNPQIITLKAPIAFGMVGELTRSVLVGETTAGGGAFVNVKVNPSGTLETNASLAAGTNNIGDVDVLTLPAITGAVTANAGTNLNTSALNLEATQLLQATAAKQDLLLTELQLKADLSETQPISAVSLPLPALAATSTKQSDGTQKTQIVDGTGAVIDSISSGGVDNLLIALGATNYVVSTVNSTVAQLAPASMFTGTVETVFNQQAFSILATSDQNGTLTVKQYIDSGGVSLISSIAYPVTASVPFARSGVLNGNYTNITFINNGGAPTTTLRIDTAYGTIPAATQLNNAPTAINEINGNIINSNIGIAGAGTQRFVIATDQPETQDSATRRRLMENQILLQTQTLYASLYSNERYSSRGGGIEIR